MVCVAEVEASRFGVGRWKCGGGLTVGSIFSRGLIRKIDLVVVLWKGYSTFLPITPRQAIDGIVDVIRVELCL